MNIGKQIQYFRKRDNMSQEKLAEKIHVSRQSISNWKMKGTIQIFIIY